MIRKNEKNNTTIALNVLYAEKENVCLTYVWKQKSNCER